MLSSLYIWVLIAISFTTFFLISWVYKRIGISNLQKALLFTNGLRLLNLKHVLGIVFFGILFYTIFPDLRYLVNTVEIPRLPILLLFFVLVFVCSYLSYVIFKKNEFENIGSSQYNLSDAGIYFVIRITFLLCYEFFFRGVLFFTFLENNSLFLAFTYSTLLYVIIHLFDSKKELLGTVPFGIVLCFFTYVTGSIWCAFLLHLTLSAIYEMAVFYCQTLKT